MIKKLFPALLLLAAMIWGFAFSAQKAAADIPPFTVGAARGIFAALFLLGLIPLFDRLNRTGRRLFSERGIDITKSEWTGGILCGLILSAATFAQQFGIGEGTDAGKASFITALYVVLVPIYGLFLGKRAPVRVFVSVGIATVGFYLLCITGDFSLAFSDGVVLICAFIFAAHILVIDAFSRKTDGVRMSCVQFFVFFLANLAGALIFESPLDFSGILSCFGAVLYLGIGSSGVAYTAQILGQKGTDPAVSSILLSMESVFGVIGSAIFLGEQMSAREYIGCAVVFFAVLLAEVDFPALIRRRKNAPSAPADSPSDSEEK